MRVLVTGHDGYIGTRRSFPLLQRGGPRGRRPRQLPLRGCALRARARAAVPAIARTSATSRPRDLRGFDAVVHLAAISNDPLGDSRPETTYDINHRGAARLARARQGGRRPALPLLVLVQPLRRRRRRPARRDGRLQPGHAVRRARRCCAEQDLPSWPTTRFSPTFLRNATAYGVSPRLRGDLVVNNLVGYAFTTARC